MNFVATDYYLLYIQTVTRFITLLHKVCGTCSDNWNTKYNRYNTYVWTILNV